MALRIGDVAPDFSADTTHRVATPVNWRQGDDVIIAGSVNNEEARLIYPDGWKEPKSYLRIVPQPAVPA